MNSTPWWVPLLSALAGGAMTFFGVLVSQIFQGKREAANRKLQQSREERAYYLNIYIQMAPTATNSKHTQSPNTVPASVRAAFWMLAPIAVQNAYNLCNEIHFEASPPMSEYDDGPPEAIAAYDALLATMNKHLETLSAQGPGQLPVTQAPPPMQLKGSV